METIRLAGTVSATPGALNRHPWRAGGRFVGALVASLLMACGCGRAPKAIPAAPPDAIRTVVKRLQNNEPEVLWEALPPTYQADIRELIGVFCTHMDAETYSRMFRILNKGVRVLKEKQDYLFKSPVALSTPMLESVMGERWNETVDLLNTIATSELASLESLRRMDPGQFMASTGRQIMEAMESLRRQSQRTPGPNPWETLGRALREARIEFQPSGEDQGWLRFQSVTNTALKDTELKRVEGRWIPLSMAASWPEKVVQAKENLAKLSGPEFQKAKPMLALAMGMLESSMDTLLKAGTQKEFDDTLKGLAAIGALLPARRDRGQ